jgi:lipopolysaccharide transport system permease protein
MKNNYKDLLIELTKKEIKIRYKNSYLGYLWSLGNPLFMAIIFYFVFKQVMRIDMPNYALFLVSGLFVWQFISNSMSLGTMLFIGNAGLIKKVNFKRDLLAVATVLSEGFNFIFSIPIIIVFMIYTGIYPTLIWIIGFPILFIITFVFLYGFALFLGSINLFFRDLERIIALLLMLAFYATPIMYPVKMIPNEYSFILYFNPFSSFIIMWRDMFLEGSLNYTYIGIASIYAFVFLGIGLWVYNKLKFKFAELI